MDDTFCTGEQGGASRLSDLRIGAVSYLNTKPLIHSLDPTRLTLDVPGKLAAAFYRDELDVALLPLFEVLRNGGGQVVDHVAIGCSGPVYSVLVASRTPLADCGQIYLDPASRSSVALLRVLVAEFTPGVALVEGTPPDGAARLIIGDPAIEFHRRLPAGWFCHDLGALWQSHFSLPFVFALWALRPGLPHAPAVAEALRQVKKDGLAAREAIAASEPDPTFALTYLKEHIRYQLGPKERTAITKFASLAKKHGLLPNPAELEFV